MKGTIKLNREFTYAYRKGKKVVSDCMVFHYYKIKRAKTVLALLCPRRLVRHTTAIVQRGLFVLPTENVCPIQSVATML